MIKSIQWNNTNSQINTNINSIIDTTVTLTNASIESIKQIAFVQCETTRSFISETNTFVKNIFAVTTPAQFTTLVQQFISSSILNSIAKSQEMYGVLNNSKTTFSTTASSTIKGAQDSLVKSVEQLSTVNPTFSKVATESLQTWISTSNQAADSASKVSAQIAEVSAKNISAATQATIDTVKKATATATAN